MENMDYIDEFFSSLSPEEMQYAKSCMSRMGDKMGKGPNVEIEIETEGEEPNESDSDKYTNGKGPNNEAKGGDARSILRCDSATPVRTLHHGDGRIYDGFLSRLGRLVSR